MCSIKALDGLVLKLLAAAALLTGSIAFAGASTTTTVTQPPVTGYVVIQPIDVCLTTGYSNTVPMSCAPYNNLTNNPNPKSYTVTTPIGYIDPTTNVNVTRAIWLQAGIDMTFLPMAFYYNASTAGSNYLTINDITCSTTCSSKLFNNLSSGKVRPAPPLSTDPSGDTINMFFVDQLVPCSGCSAATPIFGFAWIGANGIAVSSYSFFPPTNAFGVPLYPAHFDTLGHEIGHNLALDHTTYGAGTLCSNVPSPYGCNVMDAGNIRVIPSDTTCSTIVSSSSDGGTLYDLATGLCTSLPNPPQADQLILGSGTNTQQSVALASPFVQPTPNVNAIAGGGDPTFTVTFPKSPSSKPNGRPNEYIAALILALPQGYAFGTPAFTFVSGQQPEVLSYEFLNGNNGQGNANCVKPISGGPSIQCLEIDFVPNTFAVNTSFTFTSNVINKNTGAFATLADLTCPSTATLECLDLTFVFSDLFATTSAFEVRDKSGNPAANSQLPDATVVSTIVNPANFPGLSPNQTFQGFTDTGCSSSSTSPSCPSAAHGGEPTSANPINGSD